MTTIPWHRRCPCGHRWPRVTDGPALRVALIGWYDAGCA